MCFEKVDFIQFFTHFHRFLPVSTVIRPARKSRFDLLLGGGRKVMKTYVLPLKRRGLSRNWPHNTLNARRLGCGCFSHRLAARHRPPNFYCEVAVSFRGVRCPVVLRRLFHSRVLATSLDRKRNRAIRVDSFPEIVGPRGRMFDLEGSNTLPLGVDRDDPIF